MAAQRRTLQYDQMLAQPEPEGGRSWTLSVHDWPTFTITDQGSDIQVMLAGNNGFASH